MLDDITALGMMSGTSCDGVDLALLRTDGSQISEYGPRIAYDYENNIRQRLLGCAERSAQSIAELERDLSQLHLDMIGDWLKEVPQEWQPELIGYHGHTVWHKPSHGISWQIGDPVILAKGLNTPVIYDFRRHDITYGGQGAPVVPIYHHARLKKVDDLNYPVAVVNIGGISNITYLESKDAEPEQMSAGDCGVGNTLIDRVMQGYYQKPYDADGEIGLSGTANLDWVSVQSQDGFYGKKFPKSLDISDLKHTLSADMTPPDRVATLAALTAYAISNAPLPSAPQTYLLCGGGRKNKAIISYIKQYARNAKVMNVDELGWNGDMIEAQAFAYLAVRSKLGLALTYPGTTGVKRAVTGGVLVEAD